MPICCLLSCDTASAVHSGVTLEDGLTDLISSFQYLGDDLIVLKNLTMRGGS
jgi:hypothetical protein